MGHDELRGVFMGAAGLSEDDMRNSTADPEFLGAVLDFICMDDAWVVEFCDMAGAAATDPMAARLQGRRCIGHDGYRNRYF